MKRKDPGEIRSIEGYYAITSAEVQRVCDVLKEAYGSCEIEINDYEVDGLHELPLIPDVEVKQVKIEGRKKPDGDKDGLRYLFRPGVSVIITEHALLISQTEKYDFTAIGVVTRLAEVFERAKITPEVADSWPTTCKISLSALVAKDVPAVSSSTPPGQPMSAKEGPVAVPVSLLDLDKVAQAVEKSFWKRNKDKIIVGIILAAFTLMGGVVVAALRGCL